jgi:hypothetical protein
MSGCNKRMQVPIERKFSYGIQLAFEDSSLVTYKPQGEGRHIELI